MRTRTSVAATLLLLATAVAVSGYPPKKGDVPLPLDASGDGFVTEADVELRTAEFVTHEISFYQYMSWKARVERPEPGSLEDGPLGDTPIFFRHQGPTWRWHRGRWRWYMPFQGRGPLWPVVPGTRRVRGGVQA